MSRRTISRNELQKVITSPAEMESLKKVLTSKCGLLTIDRILTVNPNCRKFLAQGKQQARTIFPSQLLVMTFSKEPSGRNAYTCVALGTVALRPIVEHEGKDKLKTTIKLCTIL